MNRNNIRFRNDIMDLDTLLFRMDTTSTDLSGRPNTLLNPSEVVENVLLGAPIPGVFRVDTWDSSTQKFYRRLVSSHLVALDDFAKNRFALSGLTILPEYNGCYYDRASDISLPLREQNRLGSCKINITILDCMPEAETAEICRRFGL